MPIPCTPFFATNFQQTHHFSSQKPATTATSTSPSLKSSPKASFGPSCGIPRWVLLGGVSVSVSLAFLPLGTDAQQEALALGPVMPLVEEFWDNMKRYGLYIPTVSSGVIYTIFQPVFEVLKNSISAILIIIVMVGSAYLAPQELSSHGWIFRFFFQIHEERTATGATPKGNRDDAVVFHLTAEKRGPMTIERDEMFIKEME